MFGLFEEHGPYILKTGQNEFTENKNSWNKEANVLYVDQPAGVGYSLCKDLDKCPHNDTSSAADNLDFLLKWYQKYPEFKTNDLYLSGESYAGIYVPYFANEIVIHNEKSEEKIINLKGIMVGNPLTSLEFFYPAILTQAYYRHILDTDSWITLMKNNCTTTEKFWKSCGNLMENLRNLTNNINMYNIYGHCYERNGNKLGSTDVDGDSIYSDLWQPNNLYDYTPWLSGKLGFQDTNEIEVTQLLENKYNLGGSIPHCTFAKPLVKYLNDKEVKRQLNVRNDTEW